MERNQCIAVVIVVGITGAILAWQYFTSEADRISRREELSATPKAAERDNPYLDLRALALSTTPETFHLKSDAEVYGVVMDWNVGSGIVTVTSLLSGDASMYTSSGGGVIGGVGHKTVRDAAIAFVKSCSDYRKHFSNSADTSAVSEGSIKFFLLTGRGRLVAEEKLENFDNSSSPLLGLFIEANKVIARLRESTPDEDHKNEP
jgi:hypothetical protein